MIRNKVLQRLSLACVYIKKKQVKFMECVEKIKKATWPEVVAESYEVFICLESYN